MKTLLQRLESEGKHVPYQCREGYCGACRQKKCEGDVIIWLEEPLAMVQPDEYLPCICSEESKIWSVL